MMHMLITLISHGNFRKKTRFCTRATLQYWQGTRRTTNGKDGITKSNVQLTLTNSSSACPSAFTAMPAQKSRYLFPSVSHTHTPLPWLNTKLGRAYTGRVYALAFSMNGAAEVDGVEGVG